MSFLCLDFGNTRLKYGVFKDDNITVQGILNKQNAYQEIVNIISQYHITKSILASVIGVDTFIQKYLDENTDFHLLTSQSKMPFSCNSIAKKETIGADRLALSAAATLYAPTAYHSLVISVGTCITYNFIDYKKSFLGGAISPGLSMRYQAMHDHTHLLPLLSPASDFPLIGYDTPTHLHSGILLGMAMEIDGIIGLYQKKYSQLFVCLTGGDVEYLDSFIKNKIFVDNYFLLKGLFAIGRLNWN